MGRIFGMETFLGCRIKYTFPAYLLVAVNLLAFSLLFTYKQQNLNVIFIGLAVLLVFMIIYSLTVLLNMGDKYLILIVEMLVSFGVLMLCRISPDLGAAQIIWVGIGAGIYYLSYFLYRKIHFWDRMWFFYLVFSISLFAATLLFGNEVGGAKNWITIGNFTLQPSEIIKILFILLISCYYSGRWSSNPFNIKQKYVVNLIAYLFLGLLVLQREWGTAVLLFLIHFFMMYVFERNIMLLALNLLLALLGGAAGYHYMYHIQVRVSTWLDPWPQIADKGYQITQSLFAIASGGYFGVGLGNGTPKYIPEVHSDFIFAAICEELGIFGGVAVILLFFLLAYRGFRISIQTENPYHKATALGLTVMFGFQTFIIIGGVIKFIPLTGITLPFISYGGSSLIASFGALGIMQAIARTGGTHENKQ